MEPAAPAELSLYRPTPGDLPAFLPYACAQLEAPFRVRMLLQAAEEYGSAFEDRTKKSKRDKPATEPSTSVTQYSSDKREVAAAGAQDDGDEDEVVMRARCDAAGAPLELAFCRCGLLPRLLMKIIGLCIPYHSQLAKLTIRWGPLDGSVLYEIAKFLPLSQITEICLDDLPVPQRNYYLLLDAPSRLRSLSLARCGLVDEDAAALAARLALSPLSPHSAHAHALTALALPSNHIADAGARALADALRTNRSLRYLNLAGNRITSAGAAHLLRCLIPFPISADEVALKRCRTFDYLRRRREVYERCYRELAALPEPAEGTRGRRRTVAARPWRPSEASPALSRGGGVDAVAIRAEIMTEELVGARSEPFEDVTVRDEVTYCAGNLALRWLNLAYNEVDCWGAARLADALAYQAEYASGGLVRIVLEGNRVDAECSAARAADALLARVAAEAAELAAPPAGRGSRRSERAKFKN